MRCHEAKCKGSGAPNPRLTAGRKAAQAQLAAMAKPAVPVPVKAAAKAEAKVVAKPKAKAVIKAIAKPATKSKSKAKAKAYN